MESGQTEEINLLAHGFPWTDTYGVLADAQTQSSDDCGAKTYAISCDGLVCDWATLFVGSGVETRRLEDLSDGPRQLHSTSEAHITLSPSSSVAAGTYTIDICATMDDYSGIVASCKPITVLVTEPPPATCTYSLVEPVADQSTVTILWADMR